MDYKLSNRYTYWSALLNRDPLSRNMRKLITFMRLKYLTNCGLTGKLRGIISDIERTRRAAVLSVEYRELTRQLRLLDEAAAVGTNIKQKIAELNDTPYRGVTKC